MYIYALLGLTYQSDRLPALEGLAAAFKVCDDSTRNSQPNNNSQKEYMMGRYRHGMWLERLDADIAWLASGKDRMHNKGRPRKGPSWSWAYAADFGMYWPPLKYFGDYHQVHVLHTSLWNKLPHSPDSISLSGHLMPASLWIDSSSNHESTGYLWRNCDVMEHQQRHSKATLQTVVRSGDLEKPELRISGREITQNHETENKHDIRKDGIFRADYLFWSSEEEQQRQLQHV